MLQRAVALLAVDHPLDLLQFGDDIGTAAKLDLLAAAAGAGLVFVDGHGPEGAVVSGQLAVVSD
jgi:hypothetical protein